MFLTIKSLYLPVKERKKDNHKGKEMRVSKKVRHLYEEKEKEVEGQTARKRKIKVEEDTPINNLTSLPILNIGQKLYLSFHSLHESIFYFSCFPGFHFYFTTMVAMVVHHITCIRLGKWWGVEIVQFCFQQPKTGSEAESLVDLGMNIYVLYLVLLLVHVVCLDGIRWQFGSLYFFVLYLLSRQLPSLSRDVNASPS